MSSNIIRFKTKKAFNQWKRRVSKVLGSGYASKKKLKKIKKGQKGYRFGFRYKTTA